MPVPLVARAAGRKFDSFEEAEHAGRLYHRGLAPAERLLGPGRIMLRPATQSGWFGYSMNSGFACWESGTRTFWRQTALSSCGLVLPHWKPCLTRRTIPS